MCVVSMVMEHKWDEWQQRYPLNPPNYIPPNMPAVLWPPLPSKEEVDEFRRLLERARDYDKKHGSFPCELEEKRKKLLDLAKELGVDISFVGAP